MQSSAGCSALMPVRMCFRRYYSFCSAVGCFDTLATTAPGCASCASSVSRRWNSRGCAMTACLGLRVSPAAVCCTLSHAWASLHAGAFCGEFGGSLVCVCVLRFAVQQRDHMQQWRVLRKCQYLRRREFVAVCVLLLTLLWTTQAWPILC